MRKKHREEEDLMRLAQNLQQLQNIEDQQPKLEEQENNVDTPARFWQTNDWLHQSKDQLLDHEENNDDTLHPLLRRFRRRKNIEEDQDE